MDNHYHLLIETPDGNLSRAMRQLNGVFNSTAKKGKKQDLSTFSDTFFRANSTQGRIYGSNISLCFMNILLAIRGGPYMTPFHMFACGPADIFQEDRRNRMTYCLLRKK